MIKVEGVRKRWERYKYVAAVVLVGAVLLIVGMGLFTLGADTAMLPIGERVGAHMTKSRRLWIVVSVSFLHCKATFSPSLSSFHEVYVCLE